MRNREEEFMKIVDPVLSEHFQKSSQETIRFCEQHSREVAGSFLDAFYGVVNRAFLLQTRQEKGKIKYLQFSHLYSSLFLKKYLMRIDVWDERLYSDTSGEEVYWNVDCIYQLFEEDIRKIKKRIEWSIPRIREYETDYIRYAYASFYHGLMKALLKNMLEALLMDNPDFWEKEGAWEDEVQILFGEYMGQADVLYTLSRGDDR